MGSGTSVAKAACGITILDNSLKSISKAVLYGRTIYHNIQKFLIYQLSINVSAMLICLLSPILNIEEPLTVVQILVVNIIMDTLAAIALGAEPVLERYMSEKPKQRDEHILNKYMKCSIATAGIFVTCIGIALLTKIPNIIPLHLGTCYFTMFVLFSVFNGFNVRTEGYNLFQKITENKSFIIVMSIIVIFQIFIAEFGGDLMQCYGMTISEWLIAITLAFMIIPVDLIKKALLRVIGHTEAHTKA